MYILKRTQHTSYDFHHTLFHFHRFLRIQSTYNWERLFVFTKKGVRDDNFNQIIRLLLHHDFITFETLELTEQGEKWLADKQQHYENERNMLDTFFSQYKGENAYQNSCFENVEYFTVSCHLCEKLSCTKKETLLDIFKPSFHLKNPYKSFSK